MLRRTSVFALMLGAHGCAGAVAAGDPVDSGEPVHDAPAPYDATSDSLADAEGHDADTADTAAPHRPTASLAFAPGLVAKYGAPLARFLPGGDFVAAFVPAGTQRFGATTIDCPVPATLLVRLGVDGTLRWSKCIAAFLLPGPGLAVTGSGDIVVVGHATASASEPGGFATIVYDHDGASRWSHIVRPMDGAAIARGVSVGDTDIAVCGVSSGAIDFGTSSLGPGAVIALYALDGTLKSASSFANTDCASLDRRAGVSTLAFSINASSEINFGSGPFTFGPGMAVATFDASGKPVRWVTFTGAGSVVDRVLQRPSTDGFVLHYRTDQAVRVGGELISPVPAAGLRSAVVSVTSGVPVFARSRDSDLRFPGDIQFASMDTFLEAASEGSPSRMLLELIDHSGVALWPSWSILDPHNQSLTSVDAAKEDFLVAGVVVDGKADLGGGHVVNALDHDSSLAGTAFVAVIH